MKIDDVKLGKDYNVCFSDDVEPFVGKVIIKEKARVLIETENRRTIAIDPRVLEEI